MPLRDDNDPVFRIVDEGCPEHCDWCGHIHIPGSAHPDVNKICPESCCTK